MTTRAPGYLQPPWPLRPLAAISPSRFTGLQACALREVWSANRAPALLPSSPAARLGIAAHRLLNEAARRLTGDRVSSRWEELVDEVEVAMAQNWLDRHLLPLREVVPDYEVRRLRAVARARELAADAVALPARRDQAGSGLFGYELLVSTPDSLAAGRVDAVLHGEHGPVIRDYKSGAIYESGMGVPTVKHKYAVQLQLYAAIYATMAGVWPARLELKALSGESANVTFTPADCSQMLGRALELRDAVNRAIASAADPEARTEVLARPSEEACRHCSYRPNCTPYRAARAVAGEGGWPLDVWGELTEARALGNGKVMLTLEAASGTVRVRGLTPGPHRHPALARLRAGDRLGVFNMRPAGSPTSYTEGLFTVIYKIDL